MTNQQSGLQRAILPVHIKIFPDSLNSTSRVFQLLKRHSAKYCLGEGIQSPLSLIANNFHEKKKFFCFFVPLLDCVVHWVFFFLLSFSSFCLAFSARIAECLLIAISVYSLLFLVYYILEIKVCLIYYLLILFLQIILSNAFSS